MKNTHAYIRQLLETENEQIGKLNQIVQQAVEEQTLLTGKLPEISGHGQTSFGERVADRVATFGGSWTFIILFLAVLFFWIILNGFMLVNRAFDPYPFILLNLILSCIAAIQAPIIMMSQNRQEAKDRQRAENDYLVNLKSEIEIRNLHQKMDLSIIDQFQHLCDIQQKQLEMLERLEHKVDRLAHQLPAQGGSYGASGK
ncbi:DUF1003 domain-containing protein [Flavihumibacter petaseus]|uniref:DUF1003 domain-containing protein n=1 Tax=Flavihumibacter petaseus NBRC 106054 TaxID=1220578 RepID=A0A0E9N179_9BACT|nr:DUF1003 domain-containing protein [Flavihumibacter petaseus]GAO43391.1 hypothetical protein FPE01S_02_04960 [Flavihumibacter petaseus NBRC 106054]